MKPRIMTVSGQPFDFIHPEMYRVDVEYIAWAISKICRYSGQCCADYKVGQHSVLVSLLVPQEYALQGLLHDAAEAYINDMVSPVKALCEDYKVIEKRVEQAIFPKLGLPYPLHPSVKQADRVLLATEKRDLLPFDKEFWDNLGPSIEPLPDPIRPIEDWREVYKLFMKRYEELTGNDS